MKSLTLSLFGEELTTENVRIMRPNYGMKTKHYQTTLVKNVKLI